MFFIFATDGVHPCYRHVEFDGFNIIRQLHASSRSHVYCSLLNDKRDIPFWLDDVIRKAVHPNPFKRYEALSDFAFNPRQPAREP